MDSNNKEFMKDMIFGEFNILPSYIISEINENNKSIYKLKDEISVEATLIIDYKTNVYSIECDGYIEEKEFILVD